MYLVIVNDDNDYSMSWTGNYAGFSCKAKGLYSVKQDAEEIAKHYEDSKVIEIPLNKKIDILLGGCIKYHSDDY